jgi:hypothetical protein
VYSIHSLCGLLSRRTVNLIEQLCEAMKKAELVRYVDGGSRVFDSATKLSLQLVDVNLLELDKLFFRQKKVVQKAFNQLCSAMAIHGSIDLNCSLDVVHHSYENSLFYLLGRVAFSLADVKKLSSEGKRHLCVLQKYYSILH